MATGDLLSFGPFLLDAEERRLTRDGVDLRIATRHFDLLCVLVGRAGQLVTKEMLISAAWPDVIVTNGSLDQALYLLRRLLRMPSGESCLETHPRRGIRFVAKVSKVPRRQSDDSLEAVLEAHRIWIDGRAALETLNVEDIARARAAFERVVEQLPEKASAHVGLANACALQFETTRTDAQPNIEALKKALEHARQARHLDPGYGEAWATLGFVLERLSWCSASAGRGPTREDALAAHQHSVMLEPDNWRHWLRLSACAWGEERIRAARRALQVMPGLALAHVLVATVFVARGLLAQALDELRQAITASHDETNASPYGCPAAYWLTGLIQLAFGHKAEAMAAFQRELDQEHSGHLYAKEVAANTWYAIGAMRFHAGERDDAQEAWFECVKRVPKHPWARAALTETPASTSTAVDAAIAQAISLCVTDDQRWFQSARPAVERALVEAPAGNAGWLLPVEPMLRLASHEDPWLGVLGKLRARAA